MPSESEIRKKAIGELTREKWLTWFPPKVKYKQADVFGIIDILAWKRRRQRNIQLTTVSNLSTRKKKIIDFLKKNKIGFPIELWAWHSREKRFKKEKIKIKIKRA